jgi:hypothetical protein
VADLAALDDLYAWLEAHPRVLHAKCDGLEMQLAPPIARFAGLEDAAPPQSPEDAELRDLQTLLLSSGADPSPFLTRRGAE